MEQRLDHQHLSPEAFKILISLERYAHASGLEPRLLELVKLRASQINGCGFCMDMHSKDARAGGETEERLNCLSAWRECPFYTDRERAALDWTEAVTRLATNNVPDDLFQRVRSHFSEKELVDLNYQVIAINAFNRLGVPFRLVPGTYKPATK